MPVEYLYALPLDTDGTCQAVPKTDALTGNEFCRFIDKQRNETVVTEYVDPDTNITMSYNTTIVVDYTEPLVNHTSHEICMYCVVGNTRSLTGLLTMEWSTCNIQCDNGEIVSCSCMESNEL